MRALRAALVALALAASNAHGQAPSAGPDAQSLSLATRGTEILPDLAEGTRVAAVSVRLDGSTGDPDRDAELETAVAARVDRLRGLPLQRVVTDGVVQTLRRLPFAASATYSTYQSVPPGQVVIVVTVVPSTAPVEGPPKAEGFLESGRFGDLPALYKDDRSLLKMILNGGAGTYATSNPFFGRADLFTQGNKAARNPAGPGTTTWAESYIEPGIGGITRLGDTPLYAYGALTYLESASWGQDLYDSGTRYHGAVEQAYAGVIYDLPGKGNSLNVSAGRQIYQLRQGFLISKIPGSTNLGPLGALWLGPRLAFDNTIVAKLKLGAFTAEAVRLEPTEFPGMETGTRIEGGTLGYNDGKTIDAALTYLRVPQSSKAYLGPDGSPIATRRGLKTLSPSVWLTAPFDLRGVWFKGEYAYQTHDEIDMSARAYALWLGYRADSTPWKPGISYRYTSFSGDDPSTGRFERYDPLLAGGQNNYVPGMLLSSVLVNANLLTHRLSLTANPSDKIGLTLEYSLHRAEQYNNRGAIGPMQALNSKALAQEVDFFCNVYVGKNYYVQGVLAAALPGEAIKQAIGDGAKTWYAAQLSLYFFF